MNRLPTKDLEALLAGATAGPWTYDASAFECIRDATDRIIICGDRDGAIYATPGDCKLIASAPDLAREVIELRKACVVAGDMADAVRLILNDVPDPAGKLTEVMNYLEDLRALISTPEKEG